MLSCVKVKWYKVDIHLCTWIHKSQRCTSFLWHRKPVIRDAQLVIWGGGEVLLVGFFCLDENNIFGGCELQTSFFVEKRISDLSYASSLSVCYHYLLVNIFFINFVNKFCFLSTFSTNFFLDFYGDILF